ncbi:unnamed protein product [Nesidiocoris tenuis]|uniref:Uncharacterized protein n=1 Tax=Nesidiocoris tenuis TaxID=355587 RepID=A0A6H5H2F5_9HEMI|nr:unnamed protein product [Nesidiocoris tenuis]
MDHCLRSNKTRPEFKVEHISNDKIIILLEAKNENLRIYFKTRSMPGVRDLRQPNTIPVRMALMRKRATVCSPEIEWPIRRPIARERRATSRLVECAGRSKLRTYPSTLQSSPYYAPLAVSGVPFRTAPPFPVELSRVTDREGRRAERARECEGLEPEGPSYCKRDPDPPQLGPFPRRTVGCSPRPPPGGALCD